MAKKPKKKSKQEASPRRAVPPQLQGAVKRFASKEAHEMFCLEFAKDFNAVRAYMAVYPESTYKSAGQSAVELLEKPGIQHRIRQILSERKKRVLLEGDEILQKVMDLGTSDVREIIDPVTQCFLPTTQWPDSIALCVSSIEIKELFAPYTGEKIGEIKKVKLWDKPKPLELLGKNKKLWTDVLETKNETIVTASAAQIEEAAEILKRKL